MTDPRGPAGATPRTLPDGTYDVIVIDADGGTGAEDAGWIELTILGGDHKGEVVGLRWTGPMADPLDLLGVPGSLIVRSGIPSVELER